jgi:catechol 2,3-dioxygenase-like lactoylglutathione lyase family enzyme
MTALCGFHHVGVLTDDLDRLLTFYRAVFDARAVRDITEDGVRNALIDVGGGALLHAFLVADGQATDTGRSRFQRGRLDHLALNAPTRDAFLELRSRLMHAGASDGRVRDFATLWSLKFRDPDGVECEVIWTANPDGWLSSPPRILAQEEIDTLLDPSTVRVAET